MNATRLSAIDAFFVAYQETSGVLMQLGVEVELKGRVTREDLDHMLSDVVHRWPPLGQRLRKHLSGLTWEGDSPVSEMLQTVGTVAEWRNRPLDPFKEPPFQVLWIADGERHVLAFRAHHAVVDGEGFFAVCAEAVRGLAEKRTQIKRIDADSIRGNRNLNLGDALKIVQRMRREALDSRSASLAMRSCVPGDISFVERELQRT
ncbi:MAG TPA: hypothetical protein VFU83_08030, partial [Pyrinomonadaceae bacterium]|nr:hypothetical protein [Pyrinomonadaceae bacterium]